MKKINIISILLILTTIFCSCRKTSFSEDENNNSFKTANIINENCSVTAKLNNQNDVDYYKIDLRAYKKKNRLLRMSLSGLRGIAMELALYDQNKKLVLKAADNFYNMTEMLANVKIKRIIYYIKISIRKKESGLVFPTLNYKLKIRTFTNKNIEYEPNNDITSSQKIESNIPITGYFSPFFSTPDKNENLIKSLKDFSKKSNRRISADLNIEKLSQRDTDFYQVRLPEQERYNASIILTSTKNVNVVLMLLDSNGKIIQYRNNHGFSSGEGISNLTLKGGKLYYIVVIGLERTINFNPVKDTYTLEFKTIAFARDQEIEPNNNLNQATEIMNKTTKGYLSPVKDQDWYKLTITSILMKAIDPNYTAISTTEEGASDRRPDRIMTVTLKGIKNIDLMFEIRDEYGGILKKVDSTGKGKDEKIANFNVKFGKTYYIVVKGAKNNIRESFTTKYKLLLGFRDRTQNEEAEPNDSSTVHISPYNLVKINNGITGYLSPGSDVDYIYVNINMPGKHKFSISGVPGIRFKLEVFDPEGFSIGSAKSQREGQGVNFTKLVNTVGMHYIVIKDSRGKNHCNNGIKYFLNVNRIESESEQNTNASGD